MTIRAGAARRARKIAVARPAAPAPTIAMSKAGGEVMAHYHLDARTNWFTVQVCRAVRIVETRRPDRPRAAVSVL
jgi:hypothetical protein